MSSSLFPPLLEWGTARNPPYPKVDMPTYVYACAECEHRFEVFQSFSAKTLRKCPQCRRSALRKVLFPAGVVFKGSGFYVNDSRPAAKKDPDSKGKDSPPDSKKEDAPKKTSEKESGGRESGAGRKGDGASRKEPAASGSKSGS